MGSDRWTAETEEMVARTLVAAGSDSYRERLVASRHARLILIALADAGLLLPPGGETREEIEVQTAALRYPCGDTERAWLRFGELMAKGWGPVEIVKRTVHIGPWVPM